MDEAPDICLLDLSLPISVSTVANSFKIEGPATEFILLPPVNTLSDFEDESTWSTLSEEFDHVINDPTILLDIFIFLEHMCNNLAEGIRNGTTSIVVDGSFDASSPIGPAGTLQSVYRSELVGVISSLTTLDNLVRHHNIIEGAVTIELDGKTTMDESRGY